MLSKLNYDALHELYGSRLTLFELPNNKITGPNAIPAVFQGHIDGVNKASISSAVGIIQEKRIDNVFIDGSNFGELTKNIKKFSPRTKTITFFHNVESRFFLGAFRQFKTMRALAILITNYLVERKSARYSDGIICLSERDSHLLGRLFGRKATWISPLSLQRNTINPTNPRQFIHTREKYALFVGGAFYANKAGITWFIKNVSPWIKIKLIIIGRGFEFYKKQLETSGNVEVIGPVDDLEKWYREAHFVIAPVFDGSGMKTKVAEALMYGKKTIGTLEAFSGYEEVADKAGWSCTTAKDFIRAIGIAEKLPLKPLDSELCRLYEQRYSYSAQRERLKTIMSSPAVDIISG